MAPPRAIAPPRAFCLRSRTVLYDRSFDFGRGASAASPSATSPAKGGAGGSPRSLSLRAALG
eukprot:861039-Alexandrium_andersonii.AAC.1